MGPRGEGVSRPKRETKPAGPTEVQGNPAEAEESQGSEFPVAETPKKKRRGAYYSL